MDDAKNQNKNRTGNNKKKKNEEKKKKFELLEEYIRLNHLRKREVEFLIFLIIIIAVYIGILFVVNEKCEATITIACCIVCFIIFLYLNVKHNSIKNTSFPENIPLKQLKIAEKHMSTNYTLYKVENYGSYIFSALITTMFQVTNIIITRATCKDIELNSSKFYGEQFIVIVTFILLFILIKEAYNHFMAAILFDPFNQIYSSKFCKDLVYEIEDRVGKGKTK